MPFCVTIDDNLRKRSPSPAGLTTPSITLLSRPGAMPVSAACEWIRRLKKRTGRRTRRFFGFFGNSLASHDVIFLVDGGQTPPALVNGA
jgi:hypothetical protein